MRVLELSRMIFRNLLRQKSIIFSSTILPIVIIWATWWITVEVPMTFELYSGKLISASMLDVHIVTGAITAMGITSAIFGFLITVEFADISKRLKQVGYSYSEINSSIFVVLFLVLLFTSSISVSFSYLLTKSDDLQGMIIATLLISFIYVSIGNLVANIYPDVTAGSLILLIFAFMDLMMIVNPMGEAIYEQSWVKFFPGYWPTQIVLEYGFSDTPSGMISQIIYSLIYFLIIMALSFFVKKIGVTMEVKK